MEYKRPDFHVPEHSGRSFTWLKGHGTSCISDLLPRMDGPIWSDAYDIGFVVESHKTGRKVLFTRVGEDHDAEGDLICYKFLSLDGRVTINIYND